MARVRKREEDNDWKKRKSNNKYERCSEENDMVNGKGKTLEDHNFNKIEDTKSRSLFEPTTDEEDGNFGYKSTGDEEESNSEAESITDEERSNSGVESMTDEDRSNSEGESTSDEERSNSEGESTYDEERSNSEGESTYDEERSNSEGESTYEEERSNSEGESSSDEEESDEKKSDEKSGNKTPRFKYTQPTIKKGFIKMWIKPDPKTTRKNKKKHRSRKSKRGAKETATPNRKDKKGHKSCSSKKDVKETVKLVVPRPKTPEPPNLRSRKCGMLIKRDFTVSNEWTVMYLLWSENFGGYMQREEFKREFVVSAKYRSINMLYYDSDRLQYEFWVVDMTPRMLKLIREKRYTLCRRGRDNIIAFDYITHGDWLGSEWHKVE